MFIDIHTIIVSKNIVCGNVYRHPHNNCECLRILYVVMFIDIHTIIVSKNIVCGNVYRHPHNNCDEEYCMW